MQDWFEAVDLYCERTGPEFWSEPLNALTNAAFVLAGLWGLLINRRNGGDTAVAVLCWWAVAIGAGSFLFHTFANRLTIWADVLPIAVFTFAYTAFAIRRYLGYGAGATLAIFLAFYAVTALLTLAVPGSLRQATSGSIGYLPAFLALLVFGLWAHGVGHRAGRYVVAAAAIFVVSVTFRVLDARVCASLPLGTHFLWHLLNGAMIAVLLAGAARHGQRRASR